MELLFLSAFICIFLAVQAKKSKKTENSTTPRKRMSLAEESPYIFDPQTKLARFLMWVNLPASTIFCWISWLNGVIPWPTPIQKLIPDKPWWPSIWFLISITLLLWLTNRWEAWYADSSRNARNGGLEHVLSRQDNEKRIEVEDRLEGQRIAETIV